MIARRYTCLAALLITLPSLAWPSPQPPGSCPRIAPRDRPAVGLALGGGGARGFAHVGVLQALEAMRVPVDYIAGTSMGSLVGGMAASGMTAAEILEVVEAIDWNDIFSDDAERRDLPLRRRQDDALGLFGPKLGVGREAPLLPTGLVAGQKVLFLLESVTALRARPASFDDLPVPFRAVATDIASGAMVVIGDGSLSEAMRASMAVPGIFDPVRQDERLLVDGGLVRTLPVDVVRAMGADVVIAVDVAAPLLPAEEIRDVLDVAEQMTSLMTVWNTRDQIESLEDGDVLIRPELGARVTSTSFTEFHHAVPLGYRAAREADGALARLALSEEAYRDWRHGVERCASGPPQIHFVRLDNRSRFADEVILSLVAIEPGETLNPARIERQLRRVYGLGFIRLASYRVVEERGLNGIEIRIREDDRGRDFIETGLTVTGSGRGSEINLQAGYLKTDLDDRGSEFRTLLQAGDDFGLFTDVYKYLDDRQRYALRSGVGWSTRDLLNFDASGQARTESDVSEAAVAFSLIREFNRRASLWVGVARYFGNLDVTVGPPADGFSYDGGEFSIGLSWDSLDNLFMPTRGSRFQLEYINSSETLGADVAFEQVRFSALHNRTYGRHNLLFASRFDSTLDDDAPLYAQITGGGFLNMSGFEPNELVGQHFGLLAAGYRFRLNQAGFMPGYAGGTLEFGGAAQRRGDVFDEGILNGSLYLGYDTPLGPLYLGYGFNEDRSGLLFLRFGAVLGGNGISLR